jgi:hypothetical protein
MREYLVSSITKIQIANYHPPTCTSRDNVQNPVHGFDTSPAAAKDAPTDKISISNEARERLNNDTTEKERFSQTEDLTQQEQKEVKRLKLRDAKVRAHELAHVAAGGGVVNGGAHYEYTLGPDGKRYVVEGYVSIDVSAENNPETTIRKMQQVRKAALAPAEPSATDRAVAAKAARVEAKARSEMREEQVNESNENGQARGTGYEQNDFAPENPPNTSGGVTTM